MIDCKLQKARAILDRKKKIYGFSEDYSERQKRHITKLNKIILELKNSLKDEISLNLSLTRTVREEALADKNVVAVFDSNLTRSLKMCDTQLNDELVIIKVYYFGIAESIIKNGFYMRGEKYVFFSASAGQIRTKKFVAVKEDLLSKCWNTLTCGLSIEKINSMGGVNKNKFLAYLALCNSATDLWIDFDIDRCIVVGDFETVVNGVVDFIDEKTYTIERKTMDVPISHTDGCGMILPGLSKKNFMCRAPWIKGLLSPFPYDKFIREANERETSINHGLIKDIYGKQYDILEDDIQIIFTKSQFKMWKYFQSWDEYKNNFKEYQCSAGKCNVEDAYITDAKFNYQMLQTLVDLTDDELKEICSITNKNLKDISSNRKIMLKVFGATDENEHKNNFQECLALYPELMQDVYTREILRDIKKSMEKEGRAGRVDIEGKYLFLIPDLYAFCEYLFLGNKNPNGLLNNGEVYCRVYPAEEKLDCLRSPHLYAEHAVRRNVYGQNSEYKRWFVTSGIYTSCHDLISKILQFDVDGDKSLVCANKTIISAAERNCKDIVPLYYEMAKAPAQQITPEAMYEGMIAAYTGGNIGEISNNITKIWNSKVPSLDAIKLLCAETNFTIDFAKTLYKPTRTKEADKIIRSAIKGKVPHFFLYAKDKAERQVERRNSSCVNRLYDIIEIHKFDFSKKQLGTFDFKMLMNNMEAEITPADLTLVKRYYELTNSVNCRMTEDSDKNNYHHVFTDIKNKLLEVDSDIYHLVDILILQLFDLKKARHKVVFWNCFGDIVLDNLRSNIDINTIMCEICGKRIYKNSNAHNMCPTCYKEHRRIYKAFKEKERRKSQKAS